MDMKLFYLKNTFMPLVFKNDFGCMAAADGSNEVNTEVQFSTTLALNDCFVAKVY